MSLADVEADVYECAARYRRDHGLNAYAAATNLVTVHAGAVDAIQMSAALAALVRAELARRALATPTVLNIGTGAVTFLTSGAGTDDRRVRILLPHPQAQAIRTVPGSPIVLPGPADEVHVWLDPPSGTLRPEFRTVEAVTCSAAAQLSSEALRPR
ncbi:hypothetical protein [Nocardia terpenica]|uniref:Uncharacterized protein n=1 Tax=Nocardia terpenica TaxID=455432 RepID=A0A291RTC7_9NOCA|nr:hypothetical protein [Nocardia terpenica]ATL70763.1 hypothetical protein CRH09_35860 [Nocardia terpenica]